MLAPSLAAGQPTATSTSQSATTQSSVSQPSIAPPSQPGARPAVAAPALGPIRSIAGPDYRLGNGDVLEVQIAGRLEVTRMQVIVDPEGAVNVPPLGAIHVGGLTLLEA